MFRKLSMFFVITFFTISAYGQSILVNDSYINVEAVNQNGTILVPVRGVFERLGYDVNYDSKTKTAVLSGSHKIVIQAGRSYFTCDNEVINPTVPQKIINSAFYIPLRAVSEAIGANVKWDSVSKTAYINHNDEKNGKGEKIAVSDAEIFDTVREEKRVVELINLERKEKGLDELVYDKELSSVAREHSRDMAKRQYFDHTTPDGLSPFDRLKKNGISYSAAGENIAAGQSNAESAVTSWLNSEGHRKNILSSEYKYVGVGLYADSSSPYGYYWTQVFKS